MKKAGAIGAEFERMAKMGRVTPDMDALLKAAEDALAKLTAAN